jgi:hypothetical protein
VHGLPGFGVVDGGVGARAVGVHEPVVGQLLGEPVEPVAGQAAVLGQVFLGRRLGRLVGHGHPRQSAL